LAAVAAGGSVNDDRRRSGGMPLADAIVAAHLNGRAR